MVVAALVKNFIFGLEIIFTLQYDSSADVNLFCDLTTQFVLENIFIYINAYMASHATPHWLSLLRDIQM